jgi:uncharacterized membrane protein
MVGKREQTVYSLSISRASSNICFDLFCDGFIKASAVLAFFGIITASAALWTSNYIVALIEIHHFEFYVVLAWKQGGDTFGGWRIRTILAK